MLTDINRIATLAKEDPARKFYSIAHLITEERLRQAFWKLRKDASAGIDGVVHSQYAADVEENIRQLHRRLVEGKYQAQPLRRVYIPKENGKQRPISIPTVSANCTRPQRAFGLGRDPSSFPSTPWSELPCT
jgi:RNA-directed DNA polymerase